MIVRIHVIIVAAAALIAGCGGSGGDQEFRAATPNELPTADFTVTPTSGKEPLLGVSFDASRSNDTDGVINAYTWDFGDGSSGLGRTISHDYPNAGDYIVSLVVTDEDGGDSTNLSTATISVSTNVAPSAVFTFSPVTDQPSPATITFDASSSTDSDGTITDYAWDFGDNQSGVGSLVSHTFDNADIAPLDFTVTLTVTDDTNDAASTSQQITVLPVNKAPVAAFTACPIAACPTPGTPPFNAPFLLTFDATGSSDLDGPIVQFDWDFGDGNTVSKTDETAPDFMTATNTYTESGTYTVSLTVSDEFGASDSISEDVVIDNRPPTALLTAAPEQGFAPLNVMFDASASFDPDGPGAPIGLIAEYQWDFGDGQTGLAQVDLDTGDIIESTLAGVGNGTGITADHDFSNIGSVTSVRGFAAAETVAIVTGDVDGNGVPDIVVGNWFKANHLFLNVDAANPLLAQNSIDIGADVDPTLDLLLEDINGDGFDDLVAVNGVVNDDATFVGYENKVYLWNDVNGSFDSGLSISATDINASTSVTVGLVNNDAFLDIVVGNQGTANRIYFGDGNGAFTASADIGVDADDTADVLLEDVDSDGDLDVVVANAGNTNRLYLGDGQGAFAGATSIGAAAANSAALAMADLDGDGDNDLVVANASDDETSINKYFANQCDDACTADTDVFAGVSGVDITEDAEPSAALVLDDVDDDGDVDLLVGNILEPSRIYLNYRNLSPFDDILFNDKIIEDPECDPDVAATCNCDVAAPDSEACTTVPVTSGEFLFSGRTTSLVTVDLTGDLSPDLISGDFGGENRSFFSSCSEPSGACSSIDTNPYSSAFPTQFPANSTTDISAGDVDGDGDLDLVVAMSMGSNQLLSSVPEAGFGLTTYLAASATDNSQAVGLADMDADGDLDLVVGNAGQASRYYANTCNGTCVPDAELFADGAFRFDISSDLANTGSIAIGDVDGDGDLDVVAGNGVFGDQPNRVYMNRCVELDPINGCLPDTNVFDPDPLAVVTPLFFDIGDDPLVPGDPVDLNNTQSVALADIDLDGDLDLIVGNDSQVNYIYFNTCDSVCAADTNPFTQDGTALDANTFATQDVRVADLDNDGDGDIVFGNAGEANRLYCNNSVPSGSFSLEGGVDVGPAGDATFAIALGDLNGDGNTDIVAGNDGANLLYYSAPGSDCFSPSSDGLQIAADEDSTRAVIIVDVGDVGDVPPDSLPDLVVGNLSSQNIINYNIGVHIVRLRVIDNAGDSSETAIVIEAQSQ